VRGIATFGYAFVAAAMFVSSAHADDVAHDLADARAKQAQLDYAGALRIVDQALARGGADATQYVELHLLAGELSAGLERTAEAEAHFARALALRPDARLPAGTSPKIQAPFDAALAKTKKLEITVSADHGLVRLTPSADPLGLVSGISVAVVDATGNHRDVVDRRATRIAIPPGTTAIEVTALDADGHRIWVGAPPAPTNSGMVGEVHGEMHPGKPEHGLFARWPTWAVITGVALGTGGVAAWRFHVAQNDFNGLRNDSTASFDDLHAAEKRGDRWGLTANIAFGAALAGAVVTTVFALRNADEPAVMVTAGPNTLGVAGRF
jgi:tetratricopeptide (TPR) repeat protein